MFAVTSNIVSVSRAVVNIVHYQYYSKLVATDGIAPTH